MGEQLINPNWHVILIHYPLGVFMLGLTLEVLLLIFRYHGTLRTAARWMVVLGAISTLPTAFAGMYALADVVSRMAQGDTGHSWHDLAASSPITPDQWKMIERHIWTNGVATVVAGLLATLAVASSNRARRTLYPVFLVLFLPCAGAMAYGAWYGGELIYREGFAVTLPPREEHSHSHSHSEASTQSTESTQTQPAQHTAGVERWVDPLQTHVTMAG